MGGQIFSGNMNFFGYLENHWREILEKFEYWKVLKKFFESWPNPYLRNVKPRCLWAPLNFCNLYPIEMKLAGDVKKG